MKIVLKNIKKMNKIPTAEEFLNQKPFINGMTRMDQRVAMIEFAKLHVEAALKKADIKGSEFMSGGANYEKYQQAIINSYPLENIK